MPHSHTGFAVAIAWPETFCKQAGAWYDPFLNVLGIAKNHYYKVGHAALVLINGGDGACHYYDFGRYHAPFGHGRVRSALTDHDLKIPFGASFDEQGDVENLAEIIHFLTNNEACHGAGRLHSGFCSVNFEMAQQAVLKMQAQSPIIYGPFVRTGTNCSRFVRTAILAGKPSFGNAFRLAFQWTISPMPLANVQALNSRNIFSPVFSLVYGAR